MRDTQGKTLYYRKVDELSGIMANDPIFCFPWGEAFLKKMAQDFLTWGESQDWEEIKRSRYIGCGVKLPKGQECEGMEF